MSVRSDTALSRVSALSQGRIFYVVCLYKHTATFNPAVRPMMTRIERCNYMPRSTLWRRECRRCLTGEKQKQKEVQQRIVEGGTAPLVSAK